MRPVRYRCRKGGIFRGEQLMHRAPPADRVPKRMADLLDWLENTHERPFVVSCVLHCELESIPTHLPTTTAGQGGYGKL